MKDKNTYSPVFERDFSNEIIFKTSRSSGPGGQNVNKVNSRVELRFNVEKSLLLTEEEKTRILQKLKNRITGEGELILFSELFRSQIKNKENVINRFYKLIEKALKPEKKRIKTKPTQASVVKRLDIKNQLSQKKQMRKRPE
ncbi:MAG: aminoacyl-tRNA hydrolase [Prolixibacteraceae bacterium]|nr:aminoacyl-tRNA hydrolase [Prolixibacteraceae bacterium]